MCVDGVGRPRFDSHAGADDGENSAGVGRKPRPTPVRLACRSCAFAASTARAKAVASRLKAGMSSVNDLEGTTYLSQSLTFGGVGESGFDKFAGPEGLRGLCLARSCCEDKLGFARTSIPPPLHYPSKGKGQDFAMGLVLFYGDGVAGKVRGIVKLIKAGGARRQGVRPACPR